MGNLCRKYLSTMFSKFFKSSPKDQKKEVSTMREILPRMELVDLRKRIEEFLKSYGLENSPVEIREDPETDRFFISAGSRNMKGLYPNMYNDVFTVYLIEGTKTLNSKIEVEYIEAIVFKVKDFTPYQYIIYRYPQTQTTYLVDDGNHKKGSIMYYNSCPHGCGSCEMELNEPVMKPEAMDWSKFLEA